MGILSWLFGSKVDYASLIEAKTPIIDVRTKAEFDGGSLPGSKNIPIDQIAKAAEKHDKESPIILVCASGMRSGAAKGILKGMGFQQVYNGGSWTSLFKYYPEED